MLNNASVWRSPKWEDVELKKYWEHSAVAYINLKRWFDRASSPLFSLFEGCILLVCLYSVWFVFLLPYECCIYVNPHCDEILSTISSMPLSFRLFVLDYIVLINTIRTAAPRAWSRILSCAQFHKLSARDEWWKGPSITSSHCDCVYDCVADATPEHQPVVLCLALWWMSDITNLPDRNESVISHQIMMFTPRIAQQMERCGHIVPGN